MIKQFKVLSVSFLVFMISNLAFAAIHNENEKLLEELTGKSTKSKISSNKDISQSLSEQYIESGRTALKQKDFILALKFFNTVIQKYPKSNEVRIAYLNKSKLYTMMGLPEQAELNFKLAEKIKTQKIK